VPVTNGWEESAAAWIADMGEHGDFARQFVLDPVMLPRAVAAQPSAVLDVGCGEGRFCRMLAAQGIAAIGIDPTCNLLAAARERDPDGTYLEGKADALPFADATFDLVVSYLSLIDIPEVASATAEMVRVLRPGGRLLIANLNSFNTAGVEIGWLSDERGNKTHYPIDHYLKERSAWVEWRGIRILNHHRPLSTYMQLFLESGLRLRYFDEPSPTPDAPSSRAEEYVRAPWFLVMEWEKAEA
jgi:SAM-dependent methyltransferase